MAGGGPQEYSESYSIQITLDAEGDVVIDNRHIIECYVIEDIFSLCVTGKLVFQDNQGLTEYGPITGKEPILITCGRQEDGGWDKVLEFESYKINRISQSMGTDPFARPLIEIYFVDKNFRKLNNYRYSKSWDEGPWLASDIWLYILKEIAEIDNLGLIQEPSLEPNIQNFYMPWWTPNEAIQWLMKRAKGAESAQPGYLMFSNTKENEIKINFCTLEKLLMQDVTDPNNYLFGSDNPEYKNKILSWKRLGIDSQQVRSLMGGHRIGWDFSSKMRLDKFGPALIPYGAEYKYENGAADFTTLGTKLLYTDINTDPFIKPGNVTLSGHSDAHYLTDLNGNDWVLRYNLQQGIIIQVRGFEGDGRSAGEMIRIEWPSEIPTEHLNLNLDGKYLVKSVIHKFGRTIPQWTQKLVLIKNGYWNPRADLYPAGKPNP